LTTNVRCEGHLGLGNWENVQADQS
jgi:hypothetical protein